MSYEMSIDIPAAAIPMHAIGVVAYMDEDGALRYGWELKGESTATAVVGLLECVKFAVLRAGS